MSLSKVEIAVDKLKAKGAKLLLSEDIEVGSRFGNQKITIYYFEIDGAFLKLYDSLEDGLSLLKARPDNGFNKDADWVLTTIESLDA